MNYNRIENTFFCRHEQFNLTLDFFLKKLNFKIYSIFPADDPDTAVLFLPNSNSNNTPQPSVCLEARKNPIIGGYLKIILDSPSFQKLSPEERTVFTPNSVTVEYVEEEPPIFPRNIPDLKENFVLCKNQADNTKTGRAGMKYRDLIPDRLGGRFIASHISITEPGPIPDYVHFHKVRFQMIYVVTGSIQVVYEDQGEPFVMSAGDCVLQPPTIRHQTLYTDGVSVLEIGCPAEHITRAEHSIVLPNSPQPQNPDREWGGQKFNFDRKETAKWSAHSLPFFQMRDSGIGKATKDLAGVRTVEISPFFKGDRSPTEVTHSGEFYFIFVTRGTISLTYKGQLHQLGLYDACTIPGNEKFSFSDWSDDFEMVEVSLPQEPTLVFAK